MPLEAIRGFLITAGLLIGMPVFPDWGIQITIAVIIGLILPQSFIEPINKFILEILPPVKLFEEKLKKVPRLKTIIPRIIAGYLFTFLIGLILIAIGLLI
ncbi:MAG: hypothetical protein J7L08_02685 [Candidatus Aenigmarchaeota archaeon]|nr:hypothetical protein [Candidatus Aenigmarchaeota archaeon]